MPEFLDIATWFDDLDLYDGYSNQYLYQGQFGTFDESAIDGTTSKRRTLSLHPDLVIPTRRVLSAVGSLWVVGDGTSDAFQNTTVRTTYWLKRVTDTLQVLTPAQACADAAGVDLAVHKVYLRATSNGVTNSDYDCFFNVFCNVAEKPAKGTYLRVGSEFFRVRASHIDINGMALAECDELDGLVRVTVSLLNSNVYDPISDTYSGGTTTVQGLIFDRYKSYQKLTQADPQILAGDMTLIIPTLKNVGQSLAIGGITYKVVAKTSELDGYNLHLRP